VRFDLQKIENLELSGVEYQQGTLSGYEARQYLLQKWGHACAYCGVQNVPLEVEHIHPKAKGGTNRVSISALPAILVTQRKDAQILLYS
jgi:5-methylcytosine-specific restriction endonuclease McrA